MMKTETRGVKRVKENQAPKMKQPHICVQRFLANTTPLCTESYFLTSKGKASKSRNSTRHDEGTVCCRSSSLFRDAPSTMTHSGFGTKVNVRRGGEGAVEMTIKRDGYDETRRKKV